MEMQILCGSYYQGISVKPTSFVIHTYIHNIIALLNNGVCIILEYLILVKVC